MIKELKINSNQLESPFYSKFLGYTPTQVNEALLKIDERSRDILTLYYGLNSAKNDAKMILSKYKISYSLFRSYLRAAINNLSKELAKEDKFYKLFGDYKPIEVDKALSKLDKKTREIMVLYYGLGCKKLTGKEIGQKYNFNHSNIEYYIKKGIKHIKQLLGAIKRNSPEDFFYSKFKEYSKDEINMAINKLENSESDIIMYYYNLAGSKLTGLEIAEKFNLGNINVRYYIQKIMKKIKNYLENLNDADRAVKPCDRFETEQFLNKEKDFKIMQKKFLSLIEIKNLNILKECLSNLDKREFKLILLYFGLDNKNIMSIEELSESLNVSKDKIYSKITSIIKSINDYDSKNLQKRKP